MVLPQPLIDNVSRGDAVLFLGSGALWGASLGSKSMPFGDDLRDILSDAFLGGTHKKESLQHVSALAISAHSINKVQDFIRDYFANISPANFHLKIPQFLWKAVFTTNYDRLVEACYELCEEKLQTHSRVLSNQDSLEEYKTTNDIVPIVKIHGCITRTNDESLPLILTVEQYNESLKGNRTNLFNYLYELSISYPIIFVGHSLQDSNIRAILQDVHKEAPNGQRHYLLKPGLDAYERDLWGEKKITAIDCTFEGFLNCIDEKIEKSSRQLSLIRPIRSHPIEKRFVSHAVASEALRRYLSESCEYMSNETPYEKFLPETFYQGGDLGWYPVAEELHIKRTTERSIEETVIRIAENERTEKTELVVLKGEAGAGKTIILRSLAWENKSSPFGIFLWIKAESALDISAIAEICQKTSERVFLIWDDAAKNSLQILHLFMEAKKLKLPITIITSERNNIWNTRCDDLDNITGNIFDLRYLNQDEIVSLIRKLELHDCLGDYLKSKTPEERIFEFREIYGRQLLVALYEATKGETFADIIFDEYQKIPDLSAQYIYKTVCTLNRLRVPVRAGLISRIHNITFEDFKKNFYKPLDKIVIIEKSSTLDIHYKARHPEIADIIFNRTLINNLDRYNEYIKILSKINISFESDRNSFRYLIRATSLIEIFPNPQDVKAIYATSLKTVGEDPYLLQQIANYERIRTDGNLIEALTLLEKAIAKSPHDRSLPHTLALTWQERANRSNDLSAKIRFRSEAKSILDRITKKWGDSSHISNSRIKLLLDNLSDLLSLHESSENIIDESIRKIEELLIETHRKFPADAYLLATEAKFAKILQDNERAIASLQKSFEANDTDPYIASRLTSLYLAKNDKENAFSILKRALDRRPADHRLNFQYAELLRKNPNGDFQNIAYYYQRAYTPSDANYEAQFWHARYVYESDNIENRRRAAKIFENIRDSKIPFTRRTAIKDYLGGQTSPRIFHGELIGKRGSFGFIRVDGSGDDLFCPSIEIRNDLWEALNIGDRVKFKIAFSYNGAFCSDVYPE